MPDNTSQTYATHRRWVPPFHGLLFLLLLANLVYQIVMAVKGFSVGAVFNILIAIALILTNWYVRQFPVTVQDRVIRLEETLRFQRLLPPNLQSRIGEFTRGQFVGLRFASDKELPALAQKVLDEKIPGPEAVKKLIKEWRPDYFRA
jgi:hypothetical protein